VTGINGKALKAISALLTALIAASVLTALTPVTTTASSQPIPANTGLKPGNAARRVKAVEALINRIECLMNRTLVLANQYNVTIPKNLSRRLAAAKEILANASSKVREEPRKAMWLAIKAGRLALPVYVYVVRHLPMKVKREILARRTSAEINATESAIIRFENVIKWMEARAVNVPKPVKEKLNDALELLNQAKELLANGTNVKRASALVIKARHELMFAYVTLMRKAGHAWRVAVLAEIALKNIVLRTVKLTAGINRTLTLIKSNKSREAIVALSMIHGYADRLLTRVEAMISHIRTSVNVNTSPIVSNVTKVLKLSKEILSEINASTTQALTALRAGDSDTAMRVLNATLTDVKPTITELLRTARLTHGALLHLTMVLEHIGKNVRAWLRKHSTHGIHVLPPLAHSMVTLIKLLENRVKAAKRAYEKGRLSCGAYDRILKGTNSVLHNVLKTLNKFPGKSLKPLAMKARHLMNIVESELAQLECKV